MVQWLSFPVILHSVAAFGANCVKFAQAGTYCQGQICSPGSPVFVNIYGLCRMKHPISTVPELLVCDCRSGFYVVTWLQLDWFASTTQMIFWEEQAFAPDR